jgi:DNA-binding CsgD family transcriptional regulator/PAS domain-containing protein
MLPPAEILSCLLKTLYGAATDSSQWEKFLRQLAETLHADSASILMRQVGKESFTVSRSWELDPEGLQRYQDYYGSVDIWAKRAQPLPAGSVCTSEALCPHDELAASEIYNDFLMRYRVEHLVSAVINSGGSRWAAISAYRDRSSPEFQRDETDLLRFLMPHLQGALRLHSRVTDLSIRATCSEAVLDAVPYGIAFIDADSAVIQTNRRAQVLLDRNDGLSIKRGRLGASSFSENQQLQFLIHEAAKVISRGASKSPGTMIVSRIRSIRPLVVFVTPVRPTGTFAPEKACVAVFIADPEQKARPPLAILQSVYGLTVAEGRLAILLLGGATLKQAAEINGTSRNTTRTHAQHIFDKLGVKRQSELVSLLLRTLAPFLDGERGGTGPSSKHSLSHPFG